MLLASCLLLDHLKLHAHGSMIRRAILSTATETRVRPIGVVWFLAVMMMMMMRIFYSRCCRFFPFVPQLHTADLGGQGSTSEVVLSIMKAVQSTGPRTLSV